MVEVRFRRRLARAAPALVLAALAGACGASSRADGTHGGKGGTGGGAAAGAPAVSGAAGGGGVGAGGSSGASASGGTGAAGKGSGGASAGATASGGSSGTAGEAGTTGDAGDTGVQAGADAIQATWAMFDFEDPVTATLTANGSTLSGRGSCGPMAAGSQISCFGDLQGTLDGRHARFSFPVEVEALGLGTNYGADVVVSEDGTRMAGSFFAAEDAATLFDGAGLLTAWVRPTMDGAWLTLEAPALRTAIEEREGAFELALTEAGGDSYATGESYQLSLRVVGAIPLLRGSLGAFWGGEMAWDDAAQTLSAGPVPATKPELPVALRLVFEDTTLSSVHATLASGDEYTFSATP